MGVMPVNQLLLSMAVPMMISMLVQALYNIVDSMFVARLSQDALNALSLAFPAQNLMVAVAVGTGVGVNAALSKSLGERNHEAVHKVAVNGLFLTMLHFLAFCVLGFTCSRVFFEMQTENAAIVEYGTSYLQICAGVSTGLFGAIMFERLLQSTGKAIYTMITQMVGAVINIILDPILVFGLFGFPRLEVAGAAIATVIGQWGGMLLGLYFNLRHNPEINFSFRRFRPDREAISRIYRVGVPTMVMNSIGSVMVFGMNQILLTFTEAATAVFGIYFKIQSFIFMPIFGLNNGMVPIISYNYGARKRERITKTIKLSIIYATVIMVIGFTVFQVIPDKLLLIFEAGEEMLAIGVPALRRISISFLLAGYCIVCGSVFQAFGRGVLSLSVSVARQLLALLPIAFFFSLTGNLNLIWYSFPLAELVSLTVSTLFLRLLYTKEIRYLEN